jgi:hypothetical protein
MVCWMDSAADLTTIHIAAVFLFDMGLHIMLAGLSARPV